MATNTLTDRSSGQTITSAFFNDIHSAIETDFVGRNASGVPTAGNNLGTAAFPWGTGRFNGLIIGGSSLDVSQIAAPPFRVKSGLTRSTSNQPAFIDAAGAAGGASLTVEGASTSLQYDVGGAAFTLSADLVESALTLAPSTLNTALVNDTDAADQADTRLWGEEQHTKDITMDAAGTNITNAIGTFQSFQIAGVTNEFFIAFVESAIKLTKCHRGFFYDSAKAPINRTSFSNNDVITLQSLGYVFLDDDLSTVDVTYNTPTYSFDQPGSPSTGDYWRDLNTANWKRHDGASFQSVDRVFVGWISLDDTDALAARCVDFDARYKADSGYKLEINTTEIVRAADQWQIVNVAGNEINFRSNLEGWNITTDLAPSADLYNATEQASTPYYMYMSDEGEPIISDIEPYQRRDLAGLYHPHNPWRALAWVFNSSGSDITKIASYHDNETELVLDGGNGHGSTNTSVRRFTNIQSDNGHFILTQSAADGDSVEIRHPGKYTFTRVDRRAGGAESAAVTKNSSDLLSNTYQDELVAFCVVPAAVAGECGGLTDCKIGDVIRFQTDGSADGTARTHTRAHMHRVGDSNE